MEKVCERGAQYEKDRVGKGLVRQDRAGGVGRDDAGGVLGGGLGSWTAAASGSAEACGPHGAGIGCGFGCANDEPPTEPGVACGAARTEPSKTGTNGTASRAAGLSGWESSAWCAAAGIWRRATAWVRPAAEAGIRTATWVQPAAAGIWRTRRGGSAGTPGRLAEST